MDVNATGIFFGREGVCLVDVSAELSDRFFSAKNKDEAERLVAFNVKRIKQISPCDYQPTKPSADDIAPLLKTEEALALQTLSAAEGPSVVRRSLQLLSNSETAAIA
jgi:hypothetical protein